MPSAFSSTVFQAFESPKSSAATANAAASSSSSTDATEGEPYALLPQKIAFVVCQGLLFCVALYKVHTMGLLPTHSSDWLAFVEPNTVSSSEARMCVNVNLRGADSSVTSGCGMVYSFKVGRRDSVVLDAIIATLSRCVEANRVARRGSQSAV